MNALRTKLIASENRATRVLDLLQECAVKLAQIRREQVGALDFENFNSIAALLDRIKEARKDGEHV